MRKPFIFEGEAKRVGKTQDVAVWIDSISLSVEEPEKGERFPPGVPAFHLKVGKHYRVTVEEIEP
jgi:hypothetical protein